MNCDTLLNGSGGITVRRVEPIGFDFSLHLDTLEEADRIDIAAFIDKWLDAFTSEDTEIYRYAQSRVLSPMYRDHDAIGFDAMLEDDLWEQWNDDLEGICPQWLSKPQNRRKLENSTAVEVDMITEALRATGAIPGMRSAGCALECALVPGT